jgi:type I restriction enzyme S subunit
MTKLERLIGELCPNGVEYVSVDDLCSISTGSQLNKETLKDEGEYPVYNGGIYPSGYHDAYNAEANTIAISQGGASAGFVNWVDVPFFAGAHCYTIKNVSDKILNRYLYFF